MSFEKTIIVFIIYSMLGWICEVLYCYLYDKTFTNRGFMYGPLCPIYGTASIIIINSLYKFIEKPFLIFAWGLLLCSLLEYLSSFIMEFLFNRKWWDYSKYRFNIRGRICLLNSLLFGIGTIIIIYLIHPLVMSFINSLDSLTLIVLSFVLLICFIIDYVFTFYSSIKQNIIA